MCIRVQHTNVWTVCEVDPLDDNNKKKVHTKFNRQQTNKIEISLTTFVFGIRLSFPHALLNLVFHRPKIVAFSVYIVFWCKFFFFSFHSPFN